jgi:phosphoglycerate dehydrogenase-like enzyme
VEAVRAAGGALVAPPAADAIVWTDPRASEELRRALTTSRARWIQLPFAGIESFVSAGVITPDRTWTCAKGIYGPATAEHAFALILAAARLLHTHARRHSWWRGEGAAPRRLAGTTALIIGTGGIGRALVQMLQPLDVTIIAVNRTGQQLAGASRTVPASELNDVLPDADWVVVAAAATPETTGLLNAKTLSLMRSDAWIINVARGSLVDTDDLLEALLSHQIGGAALDVTDPEPLPNDHPLWDMENVIITSHTANTAEMAMPELSALVRRNIALFEAGEQLEGLVDPALGY